MRDDLDREGETVNLYEAKTHLSDLVERAAAGHEVVIAKAGRPRARLTALPTKTTPRKPGIWKGRVWISADLDDDLPEDLAAAFEGKAE